VAVDPQIEVEVGPEVETGTGVEVGGWVLDGEWRHRRVHLGADTCLAGTDRPLTGVLFGHLDIVTGTPPSGPMNPTVDLQIRLFSPPSVGTIVFTARTLRLGRTLYVGEAEMRNEGDSSPFGIGIATFVNQPVPFPERSDPGMGGRSDWSEFHGRGMTPLGTRRVAAGTLELAADLNTPQGTVSGATLGRLVEATALDLFAESGSQVVDELDVRFLNKVKRGPLVASAALLARRDDSVTVRVDVRDAGDADRLVTYALAVCRGVGS
jgi:acyl-coenzyme A thioesterase PaaI-like protein